MIESKDNKTTVSFGDYKRATIVISKIPFSSTVTLQEISNEEVKIGQEVSSEDIKPLPKIDLVFTRVESIDALIKVLEAARNTLVNGSLAMAC